MSVSGLLRDIAIIILAVQSIVISALLIILVFQVWRLVRMLQTEIKPILKDSQETVSTVRGTAAFTSENIVAPVAKIQGKVAGIRRFMKVLSRDLTPPQSTKSPTSGQNQK